MLFDLSDPRRKNVLRVVYAFLAVIFAVGFIGFGIGGELGGGGILDEIFGTNSGSTASQYEDQIEDIEQQLEADPDNEELLAELITLRYQSGRLQLEVNEETGEVVLTDDARSEYDKAADLWARYMELEPADPDLGAAGNMRDAFELLGNYRGAAEAQAILAEANPSVGTYGTLAYYRFAALDIKGGDEAKELALAEAEDREARESLDELDDLRKRAVKAKKQLRKNPSAGSELTDPAGQLSGNLPQLTFPSGSP